MGKGCRTLPGAGDEVRWDAAVGGSGYRAAEQENDQKEAGVKVILSLIQLYRFSYKDCTLT